MGRCYSAAMSLRQPAIPDLWLISDARNDAALDAVLAGLPRGSGLIFRHYHLAGAKRAARFAALARRARRFGHVAVFSGTMAEARRRGAAGAYGGAERLAKGGRGLRLVTVHSLRELAAAHRARADAVLLSPVFETRSHPGSKVLGPVRFRLIAARSRVPVIALGGMNSLRAKRAGARKWAAIDGITQKATRRNPVDS